MLKWFLCGVKRFIWKQQNLFHCKSQMWSVGKVFQAFLSNEYLPGAKQSYSGWVGPISERHINSQETTWPLLCHIPGIFLVWILPPADFRTQSWKPWLEGLISEISVGLQVTYFLWFCYAWTKTQVAWWRQRKQL